MTTTTGVTTEKSTPMDNLKAIKATIDEKAPPFVDYAVGQMLRLFNEGIKNLDSEVYKSMAGNLGGKAAPAVSRFAKQCKTMKYPPSEEEIKKMFKEVQALNEDLTGDSEWKPFWDKVKNEFPDAKKQEFINQIKESNPNIDEGALQIKLNETIDNHITEMQNRVLSAYRFKVIQKVFVDNMNKPDAGDLTKFNKLQQTINGVILRSKPNEYLFEIFEQNQITSFGPYFVDDINNILQKATKMSEEGKSEKEIKNFMEIEKKKAFLHIAGAKSGETYSSYFGMKKAEALFNQLFKVDDMYARVNKYKEYKDKAGIDIDDELQTLNYISGSGVSIDKRVLDEHIKNLKNHAYYANGTTNEDMTKTSTPEQIAESRGKVQKLYKKDETDLRDFFAKKLLGIAKEGNLQEFAICKKIQENFGGLDSDQKKELQESLSKRLFDAVEKNDTRLMEAVLPHVDVNQKNENNLTALQIAAIQGKKEYVGPLIKAGAKDEPTTDYTRSLGQKFKDAFGKIPAGGFKGFFDRFTKNPPRTALELAKISGQSDTAQEISSSKDQKIKDEVELEEFLTKHDLPKPSSVSPQVTPTVEPLSPPTPSLTNVSTLSPRPKISPAPIPTAPLSQHLEVAIKNNQIVDGENKLSPDELTKINDFTSAIKKLESSNNQRGITKMVAELKNDEKVSPRIKEVLRICLLNKPLEKSTITLGDKDTGITEGLVGSRVAQFSTLPQPTPFNSQKPNKTTTENIQPPSTKVKRRPSEM